MIIQGAIASGIVQRILDFFARLILSLFQFRSARRCHSISRILQNPSEWAITLADRQSQYPVASRWSGWKSSPIYWRKCLTASRQGPEFSGKNKDSLYFIICDTLLYQHIFKSSGTFKENPYDAAILGKWGLTFRHNMIYKMHYIG